jgi:hypothetical protein
MEIDSTDPLSSGYSVSRFFELTGSSEYLAQVYQIRQEATLSYYFDLSALQDSFRFRALHRARAIASRLIDDSGEWDLNSLSRIAEALKTSGYAFYPEGQNDGIITEHMLAFLTRLASDEKLRKDIKRFQKPLCHSAAERLILDTLRLTSEHALTNAHIRRAVLCACLTPLRQSVGSCFASAPAILIQREQVDVFLDDLYQLLSTGKLKRTFGGREYAVPLSPNIGAGDLRKNLLLLDPKAIVHYSPGIIAACEVLGVFSAEAPQEKKVEILEKGLASWLKDKKKMTVEDLIQAILLQQMGMIESDLHNATLSRAEIKALQMHGSSPGALMQKTGMVEEFFRRERQAKAAFMGLCDNALLKAWEYSLASLCDVKMEFSRWNLYTSLGFSTDEPSGIGELIHKHIEEKLQKINEKIQKFQQESQAAYDAAKTAEVLLRQAGSESEARRLQAEYQSRSFHMQSCLSLRDELYAEGSHYSNFISFLLEKYDALFPEYFQEIYDPNMAQPNVELHEDSLAGFRLVYKHGRIDPSQWTLIYREEEYIDSLCDFFSSIEPRIAPEIEWEDGKKELSFLTTALLSFLRGSAFIKAAHERVSRGGAASKKPWAYLSGGGVETLLKTYFCRENEYTKEEKRLENSSELLIFIVDAFKGMRPLASDPFLKDPDKRMLITSPSHAFLLLPGQPKIAEGWQENGFTYTWARDQIFLPSQKFYESVQLTQTQQIFLLDAFCRELPPLLSHDLHKSFHAESLPVSIPTFRQKMLEALCACTEAKHPFHKKVFADGLDGFLFQTLPIVSGSDWKFLIRQLLSDLYDDACKEFLYPLNHAPCAYMTAKKIKELAKIVYTHSRRSLFSSFDLHKYIADHARFIGLAPPTSLILADTNWPNQYFGCVVNPGTLRLELWTLDRTASQGTSMSDVASWFDSEGRIPWTLYANPAEYTGGTSVHEHMRKGIEKV